MSDVRWVRGPRRWGSLAAAGGLAIATTILATGRETGWAGLTLLGVLAALVSYLADVLPDEFERRSVEKAGRAQLVRSATSTFIRNGQDVRKVGELSLAEFGVHRARSEVDFQPRAAGDELMEALAIGQPALLIGRSMAGKSRLGAEVLKKLFPERRIWIFHPSKLPEFLEQGVPAASVVWLDDLERYLSVPELRADWVQVLTAESAVVVATIRSSERAAFVARSDIRQPPQRDRRPGRRPSRESGTSQGPTRPGGSGGCHTGRPRSLSWWWPHGREPTRRRARHPSFGGCAG